MEWVYLSPHLDDAILSCGGLISNQMNNGEQVTILTICAGDPPDQPFSPYARMLHDRWQVGRDASEIRRIEDTVACGQLGAAYVHFDTPDCIYRMDKDQADYYYQTDEAIFGEVDPGEADLVNQVAQLIKENLPEDAAVICPLTLGGHVDHRLTRKAAEQLGIPLLYYADYPYVLYDTPESRKLDDFNVYTVSPKGLEAWQDAVSEYQSQISTFWYDEASMRTSIRAYWEKFGGIRLWLSP